MDCPRSHDPSPAQAPAEGDDELPDLFGTETVAELFARQGRVADAVGIYQRLLGKGPDDARRRKWQARLEDLQQRIGRRATRSAAEPEPEPEPEPAAAPAPAPPPAANAPRAAEADDPAPAPLRLPMVVKQPVRGGQIVYAEARDLIVLAPTNPGAELLADGNIHIYAPLRGRAIAGVQGCAQAQIFCLRLEAELVGIGDALLSAEQIPPALWGKSARIFLEHGRCVVTAL